MMRSTQACRAESRRPPSIPDVDEASAWCASAGAASSPPPPDPFEDVPLPDVPLDDAAPDDPVPAPLLLVPMLASDEDEELEELPVPPLLDASSLSSPPWGPPAPTTGKSGDCWEEVHAGTATAAHKSVVRIGRRTTI